MLRSSTTLVSTQDLAVRFREPPSITFTATIHSTNGVPADAGLVRFYNGSRLMGTAELSAGVAKFDTAALSIGSNSITATYGGDADFGPSLSSPLTQVVNPANKSLTSTSIVSSLNPSIYGQKVTFTAMVTNDGKFPRPTGTVVFVRGGTSTIGAAILDSNGVATLTKSTLTAEAYAITAVYRGDANNVSSTSPVLNQIVTQTTSKAVITSSLNPAVLGQTVTFTAKITSPTVVPTGPVIFTAGKTVLGTLQLTRGVAAFTTSSLPSGSTKVTVTFNGNSNITRSTASLVQVVH